MMLFALAIAIAAILTLMVAALGVVRLPDALSRQHAVTKAATLAVAMFAVSLMLAAYASGWGFGWMVRLIVMVVILLCVLPLASHALGRAGLAESRIAEREPP